MFETGTSATSQIKQIYEASLQVEDLELLLQNQGHPIPFFLFFFLIQL